MKNILYFLFTFLIVVGCGEDDNPVQNNTIAGTWQIYSVKVSLDDLTQQAPESEVISITFQNNGRFSGMTTINSFGGRYEVRAEVLTLLEFETTEALDTPFGLEFYKAIEAAILPNAMQAQFDMAMTDENELTLSFVDSGVMNLRR